MGQKKGKQTIKFDDSVFVRGYYSSVGKKEGEGPLGSCFDVVCDDEYMNSQSWEEAENRMLETTVTGAFTNAGITCNDVDYAFSGDLLNQCVGSSFALKGMDIPFYGVYGACSTMAETMGLGAVMIDGGYGKNVLAATSSHFCSCEKQYRFPLEYGSIRTPTSQWTVTGSGAVILSDDRSDICIDTVTTGRMVDLGITDANNMGAAMAPAAADSIYNHFRDMQIDTDYYDCIVTGDLGNVGSDLLLEILKNQGMDISGRHKDCGKMIFDPESQNTNAGGSGCGCSGSVFCGFFLNKIKQGEIARMLLVCTGALMSPTTVQLGKNIVGIAHAVGVSGRKN